MAVKKQPKIIEASVTVQYGAKLEVTQFSDYRNFMLESGAKWSVPAGWTDEEIELFRQTKLIELREELEPMLQEEMDQISAERNGASE